MKNFFFSTTTNQAILSLLELIAIIQKNKFTIIQTQTLKADFMVFAVKFLLMFKGISILHLAVRQNDIFLAKTWWTQLKNRAFSLSCHIVDHNVAVSKYIVKRLRHFKVNKKKISYIANGTSIEKPNLNPSSDLVRIYYTGPLVKRKNVSVLIHALARIPDAFQAYIFGEGDQLAYLKDLAFRSNLGKKIHWEGEKVFPTQFFTPNAIFVLPSLNEGLSFSLLEAMSHQLACIASDIPGNRQLITHRKTGLLFSPNNSTQLAKYIKLLIEDIALRKKIATNARNLIIDKYTLKNMIKKYFSLYQKLFVENDLYGK